MADLHWKREPALVEENLRETVEPTGTSVAERADIAVSGLSRQLSATWGAEAGRLAQPVA